jgi:hypothetical protein
MTRKHRSLHRLIWPILALLVVLGVALALWRRPPPEHAAMIPLWQVAGAPAPLTPTLSPQARREEARAKEQGA